ncbi:ATP-binding protein [Ornithinibacillus gellani]|uniref:ATP-binding protein n=1 Tax=Ornithinibacillus gellani TaxID=2293253 RepID=UPI001CC2117C|nr:ATP-binding protein [Ornithinibacillus gellani]
MVPNKKEREYKLDMELMASENEHDLPFKSSLSSLPKNMLKWIEQSSNELIVVSNQKGRIEFISPSVKWLLGFNQEDLIGLPWKDLVYEADASDISAIYDKNCKKAQQFKVQVRKNNDRLLYCECKAGNFYDEHSNRNYYIGILSDITEKKEVEEMMIRSEKMSIAGQLAAGIAHEIRNPLTAIKGFLQLLQAGVNRKDAYYKIMIDEIEKIETITSELLFISKPVTHHMQRESVNQMILDVISLLKPEAKLKDIEILCRQKQDAFIYCDRSQIKQVLINLVKNAIEAMDAAGMIIVHVHPNETGIFLDVIDEGNGVPKEAIHKLGEPFFTTKKNGTGLGLMITKQILQRHDAALQIINNMEKGSTFRISFPIKDETST